MTPEHDSAVFMSRPSDTDLLASTTKAVAVKPLTPTSFAQNQMRLGTSPKPDAEVGIRSSGRHTPIETKN